MVLGIGNEIGAEKALRKKFPKNCKFYGVDPVAKPNKKLFESVPGKYHRGAIGAVSGAKKVTVLIGN